MTLLFLIKANNGAGVRIVVSKKTADKAVLRNKIKRRTRAVCVLLKKEGVSIHNKTIMPTGEVAVAPFSVIIETLRGVLARKR